MTEASERTTLLRPSANHEHSRMWSPNTFICASSKYEYYAVV